MADNDRPTRAVALSRPHPDLPTEAEFVLMQRLAKMFQESGLYKNIKNVAQAIAIVQTGRELGIPPSTALREISIVGGKPTCSATLMAGLVQRDHGHGALRVVESDNDHCTVRYQRPGWTEWGAITWTIDDAIRAGLLIRQPDGSLIGKRGEYNPNEPANWEKFPRAMLRSRAIAEAARSAFQDSVLGLYTPEELAPDRVVITEEGDLVLDENVIETQAEVQPRRDVDLETGEIIYATPLPVETTPVETQATVVATPAPTRATDERKALLDEVRAAAKALGKIVPEGPGAMKALNALAKECSMEERKGWADVTPGWLGALRDALRQKAPASSDKQSRGPELVAAYHKMLAKASTAEDFADLAMAISNDRNRSLLTPQEEDGLQSYLDTQQRAAGALADVGEMAEVPA